MQLSPQLVQRLGQFFSRLLEGELDCPSSLALALDRLSDLAWEEAEAEERLMAEEELMPPSLQFD